MAAPATIEANAGPKGDAAGSILTVRDLAVAYRRGGRALDVVNGVSFDVRPGEIFGLVGESGSGKSTVIRSLIQLLPANASIGGGSVAFAGRDLLRLREREMRQEIG